MSETAGWRFYLFESTAQYIVDFISFVMYIPHELRSTRNANLGLKYTSS
jgi:hypothetical protein